MLNLNFRHEASISNFKAQGFDLPPTTALVLGDLLTTSTLFNRSSSIIAFKLPSLKNPTAINHLVNFFFFGGAKSFFSTAHFYLESQMLQRFLFFIHTFFQKGTLALFRFASQSIFVYYMKGKEYEAKGLDNHLLQEHAELRRFRAYACHHFRMCFSNFLTLLRS